MKLAINYSTAASKLLASGEIQVDLFKTPPWPGMIAEASSQSRVAVHFEFQAGHGGMHTVDWKKIQAILDQTGTPYINLHLEVGPREFPGFSPDTPDPALREQALRLMLSDVQTTVQHFGPERVIIENVPYRGRAGKVLRPSVEPDLINYIVERTGCGLLFDLSHARIAAHYLGIDERAYISQLPVEHIREFHFTGIAVIDGVLQDHLCPTDDDWHTLEWVIKHIQSGGWGKPWMAAFEYGGVGEKFAWRSFPQVIKTHMNRLYELVHAI